MESVVEDWRVDMAKPDSGLIVDVDGILGVLSELSGL